MKPYQTNIRATIDITKKCKFNSNIRDKQIYRGYKVIDSDFNEIIDCRIYWPSQTCYCAIWITDTNQKKFGRIDYDEKNLKLQGTGSAGGYGYDKESAAVSDALTNSGVTLSKRISGVGQDALESALIAAANIFNKKNKYLINFYG